MDLHRDCVVLIVRHWRGQRGGARENGHHWGGLLASHRLMRVVPRSIVPPKEGALRRGVSAEGPIITTVVSLDAGVLCHLCAPALGEVLGLVGQQTSLWN